MTVKGTAREVMALLRDGPLQAKDVGEAVGVDTSAAYRHLERLMSEDLVTSEEVVEGPGRPKKVYSLTEAGWEAFPRDYRLLLSSLVETIVAREGQEALETYLDAIARELATPIARKENLEERLDALVDLYNDLGFEAHLERDGDELVLVQRNCPFLQVAKDNPDALCRCLDEGIQRAALPDAQIELESSLAQGAKRCQHKLSPPPTGDGG